MTPAFRKALPVVVLVPLVGLGALAWFCRPPPAPAASQAPASPAARTRAKATVPSRLEFLTDTEQPWQVRIDLLRKALRTECSEAEIRHLYVLLESGAPEGELPDHWYVIANDLMEQLACHDPDARRFSSKMLGFLDNEEMPLVLRDYAAQHLATWIRPYPRRPDEPAALATKAGGESLPQEILDLVLTGLVRAATDPQLEQSSIPGTVCMMLVDLSRSPLAADCAKTTAALQPWLARALEDGSTLGTPARVSAVQAAAVLAPDEFRPALRRIAFATNGQSCLRLPAIAALANCGEDADLEKLQLIARSDPQLSHAASTASRTLSARLGSTPPNN